MIPHDFQGILDNIDRKTSCSDLATSLAWRLFLENARTRLLYLATPWIFTLCLPLYQLDIFVSWGEFVQLKLCGKEGRVANHPVFLGSPCFKSMLQKAHAMTSVAPALRKCSGLDMDVTDNCLHSVGFDEAMFSVNLRGCWMDVLISRCVANRWMTTTTTTSHQWTSYGIWHGMAWPMVTPVFECCAKAKQSVSWVEAMAVCEGLRRWRCDHPSFEFNALGRECYLLWMSCSRKR